MSEYRLFVDIQTVQSLRFGDRGIPRFATEVSRALLGAGAPVAALALNPLLPWPGRIHPELAAAPQLTWNTAGALRRARARGPVASLVISPFEIARPAHGVLAAHTVDVPQMVMVHDLIPEVVAGYDPDSPWGRVYTRRRQWARDADVLVTPSEHTRGDVIDRWGVDPDRIAVVGEAASPFFCPPGPGDDPGAEVRAAVPAITRPYVLCVSGWDPHKNTETLVEAWAELGGSVRRDHQLVIACTLPDEGRRRWTRLARSRGLGSDELVLTGFVEDEVLRALYRAAELFVLPSHYEGFGLPVLEAAACSGAAITSDASSLPEILDWRHATFPPSDTSALASLVERALSDSTYRRELDAVCRRATARHTWRRVVSRVLAARTRLPDPARARPHRLRIALVGAFPPTTNGSAAANAGVAERLATQCDVDCFAEPADGPPVGRVAVSRPFRLFPARALGATFSPATYDALVYALTGSSHAEVRRLARTYPGVVWFRDDASAVPELATGARGLIVGSESARARLGPDAATTPTWVATDADVASAVLEAAVADLEPARPEAAPVSATTG